MVQAPWYVMALAAAIVWGLHYPLVDHALKRLSLPFVVALTAVPLVALLLFFPAQLAADLRTLAAASWGERLLLLAPGLTSLTATVMLFAAIGGKNATLASLIEITYPAFVALFALLLFGQRHLTPSATLGGLLVMAGVAVIAFGNR